MASTDASSGASKLSLKLLIDREADKVLFAEAGKEVVDFLFSLLSLSLGSVVKHLSKDRMEGSVGNIYKSIEELDDTYLQNIKIKSTLFSPTHSTSPSLLLPGPSFSSASSSASKEFFRCANVGHCHGYVSDVEGVLCPNCRMKMNKLLTYVKDNEEEDENPDVGYVKGVMTYTIMDDLTVTPMSSISSITLLNKFNVKNLDALVERNVTLGRNEVILFILVN